MSMYRKLLNNSQFRLLWSIQIISGVATELFNIGVMVTIFEQTGSTLQTVGVMVARMLPAFLLSPFAGVAVDRYSRKWLLVVIDLARIGLVLLVFLAGNADPIGEGQFSVWGVYAIIAALAVADTVYRPARLAIVPSLVSRSQLVHANSLILSTQQITLAASYGGGGALVLWLNLRRIVLIDVGLFLVAVLLGLLLVVPRRKDSDSGLLRPTFWREIVDGLGYLRRHKIARPLIIMETIEHWPHGIWTAAIMLAFTIQGLGGTTLDWGYQASGYFLGNVVGSALAVVGAAYLARKPGWVIIGNAFLAGLLTWLYAGSSGVLMATFVAFIFGPPFALRDVAQDALLQATVDNNMLGRVYASREMMRSLSYMAAGLFFAWLTDQIPVRYVYVIGGILYIGTALYALQFKAIRQSRLDSPPEPAPRGPLAQDDLIR